MKLLNENELFKNKIVWDSKKKQVVYCIIVTVMIVVLAFGDQIMLHFIAKDANPNNTTFGNKDDEPYTVGFLDELTITQIITKINNKDTFILLSSRENCYTCRKYIPIVHQVFQDYNISGYFLNRTNYDSDNADYIELTKIDERLAKNLQYTPYIMYFKDGKLQDELVGSKKENVVVDFVQRNELMNLEN